MVVLGWLLRIRLYLGLLIGWNLKSKAARFVEATSQKKMPVGKADGHFFNFKFTPDRDLTQVSSEKG